MEIFIVEFWGMQINLLAQSIELVILILLCTAYQFPRRKFLCFMLATTLLAVADGAILGGWTQVIRNGVSFIRTLTLIFLFIDKKREMPYWLIGCFCLAVIIPSAFFINVWWAIFPIICSVTFAIVTCQKNMVIQKIGACFVEIINAVYCAFLGAYIGSLTSLILTVFIIISLIKLLKKMKKMKEAANV